MFLAVSCCWLFLRGKRVLVFRGHKDNRQIMGKYFSEIIFFNELAMFVAKVKFFWGEFLFSCSEGQVNTHTQKKNWNFAIKPRKQRNKLIFVVDLYCKILKLLYLIWGFFFFFNRLLIFYWFIDISSPLHESCKTEARSLECPCADLAGFLFSPPIERDMI